MLSSHDAARVAELFDLGTDVRVVGNPRRGVLGQVWPVQTDRGRWAVKEPFEAQDEAAEEANATFAELVFASGITTPQTMRTPDGRLLAAVDGKQFRVYSWVEIEDADPNIDPALVGELVAKLHLIRVHRDEEVDPWFTDPVGADRWRDLAAQHAARRSQWARSLAEYVTELAALEAMLEPPQALQVCHRDLWADNVRRHKPGGLCVFDWEDAGNGDPSHELAAVLFEYARGDPVRAHTLMSAYIEAGGPGRIAGRGTFTMAIAQLGHIGERSCQIWLDSDDPEERERADAGLQEFLDARLSISGIDLLIGAAQSADSAGRHS